METATSILLIILVLCLIALWVGCAKLWDINRKKAEEINSLREQRWELTRLLLKKSTPPENPAPKPATPSITAYRVTQLTNGSFIIEGFVEKIVDNEIKKEWRKLKRDGTVYASLHPEGGLFPFGVTIGEYKTKREADEAVQRFVEGDRHFEEVPAKR